MRLHVRVVGRGSVCNCACLYACASVCLQICSQSMQARIKHGSHKVMLCDNCHKAADEAAHMSSTVFGSGWFRMGWSSKSKIRVLDIWIWRPYLLNHPCCCSTQVQAFYSLDIHTF